MFHTLIGNTQVKTDELMNSYRNELPYIESKVKRINEALTIVSDAYSDERGFNKKTRDAIMERNYDIHRANFNNEAISLDLETCEFKYDVNIEIANLAKYDIKYGMYSSSFNMDHYIENPYIEMTYSNAIALDDIKGKDRIKMGNIEKEIKSDLKDLIIIWNKALEEDDNLEKNRMIKELLSITKYGVLRSLCNNDFIIAKTIFNNMGNVQKVRIDLLKNAGLSVDFIVGMKLKEKNISIGSNINEGKIKKNN